MAGHQFPQSTTTGKRGTVKLLYSILFNEFTTIVDHYSQRYSSNCSTAFFASHFTTRLFHAIMCSKMSVNLVLNPNHTGPAKVWGKAPILYLKPRRSALTPVTKMTGRRNFKWPWLFFKEPPGEQFWWSIVKCNCGFLAVLGWGESRKIGGYLPVSVTCRTQRARFGRCTVNY